MTGHATIFEGVRPDELSAPIRAASPRQRRKTFTNQLYRDYFPALVRSTSSRISHFESRETSSVAVLRTIRSPRRSSTRWAVFSTRSSATPGDAGLAIVACTALGGTAGIGGLGGISLFG